MKWADAPRSVLDPAEHVVMSQVITNLMNTYGHKPGILGFEVGLNPSNISRLCIRAFIEDVFPLPALPDTYLGADVVPIICSAHLGSSLNPKDPS